MVAEIKKIENKFAEDASMILASDSKITGEDRITKLARVSAFYKMSGKTCVPAIKLKALINRTEPKVTDVELELIRRRSDELIKFDKQKRADNVKIFNQKYGSAVGNKYPDNLYKWGQSESGMLVLIGIKHPETVQYISDKLHTVSFADQLYIYKDGIYQRDIHLVDAMVIDILHDRGVEQSECATSGNIILALKGKNQYDKYPFNTTKDVIPVKNGQIRLTEKGWILEPHSPDTMAAWKLPIEYDPNADTKPIMDILLSWVDEDDIQPLLQVPAQALLQQCKYGPYKKATLITGKTDAAKSQYLRLLHRVFDGYFSEVPLQEIGNRFNAADMEGMIINIADELKDDAMHDLNSFKNFTGSYAHKIERKMLQAYTGCVNASHVFACNTPPTVIDSSDTAFWNRWIHIRFPNSFPQDSTWFDRTITDKVISGFLNLVLEAYKCVKAEGLVSKLNIEEMEAVWLWQSSPECRFKLDMMIAEPTEVNGIPIQDCYNAYLKWCEVGRVTPKAIRVFGKMMSSMCVQKHRPTIGGKRVDCYKGFHLKGATEKITQLPNNIS